MPYTGDSITNIAEGLQNFAGGMLQGTQVATQRDVAKARIQALQHAQMTEEQERQAQGEMLGMLQEQVQAPEQRAITGRMAGGVAAQTMLGLPVDPGYAEEARIATEALQKKVARVTAIGSRLSPQAANLFAREQLGELAVQAKQARAGYFRERLSNVLNFGLAPGPNDLQLPNAQEYASRVKALDEMVQMEGVTAAAERELLSIKRDIARDETRLQTRATEAAYIGQDIMEMQAAKAPVKVVRDVVEAASEHKAGLIDYEEYQRRKERAQKGEMSPQEMWRMANTLAADEAKATNAQPDEYQGLVQKHLRGLSGQPEPPPPMPRVEGRAGAQPPPTFREPEANPMSSTAEKMDQSSPLPQDKESRVKALAEAVMARMTPEQVKESLGIDLSALSKSEQRQVKKLVEEMRRDKAGAGVGVK